LTGGAHAFPRSRRLKKAEEFQRVFKRPERSADRFFTVLAIPNGKRQPRLGLAISKKTVRRAIDRNRVKRLVRESFRQHQQVIGGWDIVVMSRRAAAEADNEQLRRSLEVHWNNLARRCVDS